MKSLSVKEFEEKIKNPDQVQIIDVREIYEIDEAFMNAENIPLFDIKQNIDKIDKTKEVIFVCRSGHRSMAVVDYLSKEGYENLYNLDGGIVEWSKRKH